MTPLLRRCVVATVVAASFVSVVGAVPASARWTAPVPSDPSAAPDAPAAPADSPLPDPGALGPEAFDELSYDLGAQAFKPSGFPAKVELRAKVYAPQVITGRAPLVVLQHGRHATCANAKTELLVWPCPAGVPEIASYRGYDALGRNLASHGMIVVSVGANGINANDDLLDDGGAAARAQLILEHLRRWKNWDASADGSPFGTRFVGHVDLDRVGLMGHSRGGEGIAAAVQLNQRSAAGFGIKAALALAPVDFGRRVIGGVELGVVLPSCDGDVSDLQGASYYDDGRYATPGDTTSKMTALLYGANHNFFNTVWTTGPGSSDDASYLGGGPSDPCSPTGPGRLTAAQQNQAGATIMAAFLRRTLDPEPTLQRFVTGTAPYPASTGSARWSIAYHAPDRLDIETWASADMYRRNLAGQLTDVKGLGTGLVCNPRLGGGFGGPDGVHVVSTPCPYGQDNSVVNDTGVLDAGWVRPGPVVRVPLAPAGVDLTAYDGLRMRVAVPGDSRNTARAKQDFSVVLEDFDGARAVVAASTGTNGLQRMTPGRGQHAVLNGVRLPLSAFSTVDLTRIKAVELRFDRTAAGRLSIADLAFTQEGTGSAEAATQGATVVAPCRAVLPPHRRLALGVRGGPAGLGPRPHRRGGHHRRFRLRHCRHASADDRAGARGTHRGGAAPRAVPPDVHPRRDRLHVGRQRLDPQRQDVLGPCRRRPDRCVLAHHAEPRHGRRHGAGLLRGDPRPTGRCRGPRVLEAEGPRRGDPQPGDVARRDRHLPGTGRRRALPPDRGPGSGLRRSGLLDLPAGRPRWGAGPGGVAAVHRGLPCRRHHVR
jgi:hypothetical protein